MCTHVLCVFGGPCIMCVCRCVQFCSRPGHNAVLESIMFVCGVYGAYVCVHVCVYVCVLHFLCCLIMYLGDISIVCPRPHALPSAPDHIHYPLPQTTYITLCPRPHTLPSAPDHMHYPLPRACVCYYAGLPPSSPTPNS